MQLISRWRWLRLILMLLATAVSGAVNAAQVEQVATDVGVTVAVPAGLRRVAGLAALPDLPVRSEGLATFTDGDVQPLNIQIRKGVPHELLSLPAANDSTSRAWARDFAAELNVQQAYDFTPGEYVPERGALSVHYRVRGPSSARLVQSLPDSHPLWSQVIEAGGDPKMTRCLVAALLGGKLSASEGELRDNTPKAAESCHIDQARVAHYIEQVGLEEFVPAITTVTCVSFFTQLGTIVTLIMAPLDRQAAVDAAAALVLAGSEVAPEARLPVDETSAQFRGRLAGIVLGSLLGVFLLGSGVSWLLVRLRVRPLLAVSVTLGVLSALALLGTLRAGELRIEGMVQVGSYLLASAILFLPLERWLSAHGAPGAGSSRKAT
jgi:hypothetical protein